MFDFSRPAIALVAAASVVGLVGAVPAKAQTTVKAVMHSDVKILDPIWTTAYVQRGFGYLVWDVLFAVETPEGPGVVTGHSVPGDKVVVKLTADGRKCACTRASVCGSRQAYEAKYGDAGQGDNSPGGTATGGTVAGEA